jgi:DNA-3-methyladenine glycosylase
MHSGSAHRVLSASAARAYWNAPLPISFYARDPVDVAQAMLGCLLLKRDGRSIIGGRIVEVEAYLGPRDPASHAVVGRTARTHHLFGAPGTVYVYRSYGVHWCVNAVTQAEGSGSAVLIRAVQPLAGLEQLATRRPDAEDAWRWCRGPGRLCGAMAIDRSLDGTGLMSGELRLSARPVALTDPIVRTQRIGITKAADWPLRFLLTGERAVSGTARQNRPHELRSAR